MRYDDCMILVSSLSLNLPPWCDLTHASTALFPAPLITMSTMRKYLLAYSIQPLLFTGRGASNPGPPAQGGQGARGDAQSPGLLQSMRCYKCVFPPSVTNPTLQVEQVGQHVVPGLAAVDHHPAKDVDLAMQAACNGQSGAGRTPLAPGKEARHKKESSLVTSQTRRRTRIVQGQRKGVVCDGEAWHGDGRPNLVLGAAQTPSPLDQEAGALVGGQRPRGRHRIRHERS